MKRLLSLAFIGAFAMASLTACSAKGAGTDFCDVSATLNEDGAFTLDDLSDSAMQDALAGDMTAVNAWGTASSAQIDGITAEIKRAKGGSPTDEATQALDDVLEAMGVMDTFASAAASATDLQSLMDEITALTDKIDAIDAKMTAAADVLDKAEQDFCN